MAAGIAHKPFGYANAPLSFDNSGDWQNPDLSCSLNHNGDGRLYLSTSIGSDSPGPYVLNLSQWYYLELHATVSVTIVSTTPPVYNVAYSCNFRVNEAPVKSFSINQNFNGTTNMVGHGFESLGVTGAGGSFNADFDDLYVTDGELLGDVKVDCRVPNAAGDLSEWTPTAAPNWSNVEEHESDDDATTVQTDTVGKRDLYNLDDLAPGSYAIKGAQALWLTKKSDAGAAAIRGLWKSGGTLIEQSSGLNFFGDFYPTYANYQYDIDAERKSLFTLADWTAAEINALQLGIKR